MAARVAPEFAHIRDWVFDLDNCLYPASTGLFELIDNDLALREARIDQAPLEVLNLCASIAAERHMAANWLCWGPEVYSDTDAST